MNKITKSKFALYLGAIVTSVIIGESIYQFGIKQNYQIALNESPSLPDYFYVLKNRFLESDLKNGEVIAFSFPKRNDRYFSENYNFIKKISCSEFQKLSYYDGKYFCNERFIGEAKDTDSKGVSVEHFKFNGIIPNGHYFVMGTAENSYDSRYWGFVNREKILGVAIW